MLTLQVIACIGIIKGAFLLFQIRLNDFTGNIDRKSTRLNSSHVALSRMPSSA